MNDKYISNGASECPFCESKEISAKEAEFGEGVANKEVTCKSCNKVWFENFTKTFEKDKCLCGSDNLSYENGEIMDTSCYQDVTCDNCGDSWTNDYDLVGWEEK